MKPSVIAVIPARGGSKGIPRKNLRLLCGRPLISYAIESALKSKKVSRVVVSTEDEEIAEVARIHGASIIVRPENLAGDDVTLDPVVFHAVNSAEQQDRQKYDFILTIQPTSPLLSAESIDRALAIITGGHYDTVISVTNATHLYWTGDLTAAIPISKERMNRQQLPPIYKESGALLICRRHVLQERSRIGRSIYLFEIPQDESIDIDSYSDWFVAEGLMRRLNIVFRVDGDEKMGLGHIYRAATLAGRMLPHHVSFLTDGSKSLGYKKLASYNYPVVTFRSHDEAFEILQRLKPDIVINDVLDTTKEYVNRLSSTGVFIVNYEDLGEGSEYANMVVNALYENSYPQPNHYYGYKYECLRDEFYLYPAATIREKVASMLVTFGGVDENNLTARTLHALESSDLADLHVVVILGLGYQFGDELDCYIERLTQKGFDIQVRQNVTMMGKYMSGSDLVVTSNGRTVYEVACLGIPCISISQNEREARHLFSQFCKGIVNLGMANSVSHTDIASALVKLIGDYRLRKAMSDNMLGFDLRKGIDRTLRVIFDGYWEWRDNQSRTQSARPGTSPAKLGK